MGRIGPIGWESSDVRNDARPIGPIRPISPINYDYDYDYERNAWRGSAVASLLTVPLRRPKVSSSITITITITITTGMFGVAALFPGWAQ